MACERFIYSAAEIVAVYDISDSLSQEFVYGQVIDEVLMLEQADVLDFDGDSNTSELTRSFYHRNALGSVMEITEMDEDVAVSYRYDPYGAVTITRNSTVESSDPLGQSVMYTGRWLDEETGLMHYRARACGPMIGRFSQRDPLGLLTGPNLYQYAESQPTVYVDPTGTTSLVPPYIPRGAGGFGFSGPGQFDARHDALHAKLAKDQAYGEKNCEWGKAYYDIKVKSAGTKPMSFTASTALVRYFSKKWNGRYYLVQKPKPPRQKIPCLVYKLDKQFSYTFTITHRSSGKKGKVTITVDIHVNFDLWNPHPTEPPPSPCASNDPVEHPGTGGDVGRGGGAEAIAEAWAAVMLAK